MDNIKPTKQQLDFLDMELGIFLHFGIRTFNEYSRDWDMIPMDVSTFNPTELDCDKWADDIASTGAKYAIMTTKHHDGFALWPSAVTEYSVKNSPWKDGKGDVVKEYTDAMRKKGIKVGLYYSCSQFDAKEQSTSYSDFVLTQITEILSNYGKIDIIWFDGCGSEGDNYDIEKIVKTIYELQPEILIFGSWGNLTRWIGNEWGLAPMKNSNVITKIDEDINNLGTKLEKAMFRSGECDCCMVRNFTENFWFYSETFKDCLRTNEEMVGLYYYSIGRGSNLLVNIGPDRRGLLPESNIEILKNMKEEIKRRFVDCKIEYKKLEKVDNEYQLEFDSNYLVDNVVLEEDMTDGQKIREFTIYTAPYHTAGRIAVYKGYTVGHKLVCQFPPIRTRTLEIVFEDADEGATLKSVTPVYTLGEQVYQRPLTEFEIKHGVL